MNMSRHSNCGRSSGVCGLPAERSGCWIEHAGFPRPRIAMATSLRVRMAIFRGTQTPVESALPDRNSRGAST